MRAIGMTIATAAAVALSGCGGTTAGPAGTNQAEASDNSAAAAGASSEPIVRTASDGALQWGGCPEGFPQGCQIAVLHGDPSKANSDVLLRVPGGASIPPHSHGSAERMILVSGQFEVKYQGAPPVLLRPGTYAYGPAGLPHRADCRSSEPCVLFIAFVDAVDAVPFEGSLDYGTMRVAGSVIWATEFKETSSRQGGGKGQAETVAYNYSVSMAVALSSRRAANVRRIWADGKLLRGAAGDFKVRTKFRFASGTEDQPVDPLIASIEGIGRSPAYRGLALAIFEDLELAEYGNRIPFLTFEVQADPDRPTIGAIITDMGGGHVDCTDPRELAGYAAHGASIRSAMEPLVEHFGVDLVQQGSRIRSPQSASHAVRDDDLGSSADRQKAARKELTQESARHLPGTITISYYDPDRDYQTGQARASIGMSDAPQERGEIPAVMNSAAAKALAESALARRWTRRDRLTLRLPPAFMPVAPGDRLQVHGEAGEWRVERSAIEGFATILELRSSEARSDSLPADPGRPQPDPDRIVSPTVLALFDLPDPGLQTPRQLALHLAAANASKSWRAVPIELAVSGVVTNGQSAHSETILGRSLGALGSGQSCLLDLVNAFEVELVDEDHWLESCDDTALVQGANVAALGNEMLQFGLAEPIGAKRFRLSRLLRGRRGSEWAMADHVAGEPFALLQPGRLRPIELSAAQLGATVEVTAYGLGDGAGTSISRTATGESLRPPSPVGLQARPAAGGGLILTWVRRSRDGWAWLDGIDAPLGEGSEVYRIRVQGTAGAVELETSTPEASVSGSELAAIGLGPALVAVTQIGDLAPSRAVTLSISIP